MSFTPAKRGTTGQGFSQCRWIPTKDQYFTPLTSETQGEDVDPMEYGHGSSLTDLLRPREREEMQAQPGEALATTKCQVNPQEPVYRPPGLLQDTAYYQTTTSLHPQQQQHHTPPQHCLGLDIVASHLTSSHLGGGKQVHLNSGGGGGHHHLTRPRQQANLFSSLSSSSSSSSPPTNTAQHYPDFQFAPEPLSPPGSHHHQYTLPCNRRLSQPSATVHLENAWNHLDPPERFSKKASGPFESTKQGGPSKVQQQQPAQPRKAPLPVPPGSKLHLSQL